MACTGTTHPVPRTGPLALHESTLESHLPVRCAPALAIATNLIRTHCLIRTHGYTEPEPASSMASPMVSLPTPAHHWHGLLLTMDTGSPWTQAHHGHRLTMLSCSPWTPAHHGHRLTMASSHSFTHWHGHRLTMASSHCFTTDTGSPWLHLTASPMGHGSVICEQQHYLCEDHCRAAAEQDIGRFNCRSMARKSTMITFFRRLVAPASSPRLTPCPYEGGRSCNCRSATQRPARPRGTTAPRVCGVACRGAANKIAECFNRFTEHTWVRNRHLVCPSCAEAPRACSGRPF
jgi:hypothetical protein